MEVWLSDLELGLRQPNSPHSGCPQQNRQDDYRLRMVRKEHNLKIATVFEAINMHSSRYHDRLERHSNRLAKARHCPELAHQEGSTEDGRRTSSYGPPSQEPGDDDDLLIVIMLIVIFVLLFCTANSC